MKAGTRKITPRYSDSEIFTILELAFGKPPNPVAPRYRRDPGLQAQVKAETDYYNDVTSMLMSLVPHADIVWVSDTRRRFYGEHGIFSFDYVPTA